MPASCVAATGAPSDTILRISARSRDTSGFLGRGQQGTGYRVCVKFGVLQFFSWPERRISIAQVYERALSRIEIMDKTGYDAVWLAEHHFNSFSVCPSVHMMGTHVAARPQRLRIGTAVRLCAVCHPLPIDPGVGRVEL